MHRVDYKKRNGEKVFEAYSRTFQSTLEKKLNEKPNLIMNIFRKIRIEILKFLMVFLLKLCYHNFTFFLKRKENSFQNSRRCFKVHLFKNIQCVTALTYIPPSFFGYRILTIFPFVYSFRNVNKTFHSNYFS